jgi:hypothetical protein
MLEKYTIHEIDYKSAMYMIVKHHYLHRVAPCSIAFGLFLGQDLKGVICYGTPSSHNLRIGIAGKEQSKNVIELTRLWVADDVPRNGESFLIGNTIKKCGKEIVVSFAEIQQGHVGTIYQATNWIYTGLSKERTDWKVEGLEKHSQTIIDKYSAKEVREVYGDRFSLVPRPRKHRYIYINAKGKRRKELLSMLLYEQLPYPKKETENAVI